MAVYKTSPKLIMSSFPEINLAGGGVMKGVRFTIYSMKWEDTWCLIRSGVQLHGQEGDDDVRLAKIKSTNPKSMNSTVRCERFPR